MREEGKKKFHREDSNAWVQERGEEKWETLMVRRDN